MSINFPFTVAKLCVLFLTFVNCFNDELLNLNVKMKQVLRNDGFHRNLTYGIVFNPKSKEESWLYEDCMVALEQELPPGVYANPDELYDLGRMQRLDAVPRNRVNIELPTEQSYPTSVQITGPIIDGKAYLWLPVHARYHAAEAGGGGAINTIIAPKLFLGCGEPRASRPHSRAAALCNGAAKHKCHWKELAYTMLTGPIKWQVPIGDLHHYYVVSIGTAAIILVGSLYLLGLLHQYNKSPRKKIQ